jgi:hypothetical protein
MSKSLLLMRGGEERDTNRILASHALIYWKE